MSDLINTKDPSKLVKQQVHTKKHLTLDQLKKQTSSLTNAAIKVAIACDISGSMSGYKITEVRRMLKEVHQPHIDAIAFNDDVYLMEPGDFSTLSASGGTAMLACLQELWQHTYKHIILMTDGEPTDGGWGNSKPAILTEAAKHTDTPIDTIGIGEHGGGGYDPDFLRELARITGGRFSDCGEPIQLTSIVQNLLLNPPKGHELKEGKDKNGAIQL